MLKSVQHLMMGRWALVFALVCLLVSLIAASCGSDDNETATTEIGATTEVGATNRNLVTNEEIGRYPRNSPQRAVLLWYQAVQFRDAEAVHSRTTDREVRRVSRRILDDAVHVVAPALGKPRIVRTRKRGQKAEVRALLQSYEPGKPKPVLEVPLTFYLVQVANEWKLDDVRFLLDGWREIRAQRAESG